MPAKRVIAAAALACVGAALTAAGYILTSGGAECESPRGGLVATPRTSSDGTFAIFSSDERHGRVVRHVLGTVTIPRCPRRVCALSYVDELVAIGAKPFAASCSSGRFLDYLEDRLQGVIRINQMLGVAQPDFETLTEISPDLIVTGNPDPQTYRQLSKIAPTVVLTSDDGDDRERLLLLGELVGKRTEAEAALVRYEAKIRAAGEVLRRKIGDRGVAFFRVFGKQYYIHGHTRGGIVLYDLLGLNPPALISTFPKGCMLSSEMLLKLDADYVFVAAENTKGTLRTRRTLQDHPAWRRVPAVHEGRVYDLTVQHQWLVPGLLARSQMIDEILQSIAPESLEAVRREADAAAREQRASGRASDRASGEGS